MRCPECVERGEESTVTPGPSSTTLIGWDRGYFKPSGEWVNNRNPNTITTGYRCSNGHRFSVKSREGEADVVLRERAWFDLASVPAETERGTT